MNLIFCSDRVKWLGKSNFYILYESLKQENA